MKMKTHFYSVFTVLLAIVLASCSNLFSPPITLFLGVSGYEDSNTCNEGIQATLTILNDGTIIKSPILQIDEKFEEKTSKTYGNNTQIRVEAFCYETGSTGHLIVEGTIRGAAKSIYTRGVDVLRVDRENTIYPFSDSCITADVKQLHPEEEIVIIKVVDPLPCISLSSFAP